MSQPLGEESGGFIELRLGGILASELAEDGVDHAGGVAVTSGADEFDRFAEGRVGGDPVQVLELEGSHTEGRCDWGREGEIRALEERLHPGIQCDLPAEDTENKRCG